MSRLTVALPFVGLCLCAPEDDGERFVQIPKRAKLKGRIDGQAVRYSASELAEIIEARYAAGKALWRSVSEQKQNIA